MIKIEHLSKKFGDLVVLKDITIEIKAGEVISIIGPSGTGKSTFLRCINLLDQPSGGSVYIDGVNILDPKVDVPKIRQKMNMVFQSFNLFSHLSVLEFGLSIIKNLTESIDYQRAGNKNRLVLVLKKMAS
ncbi:MAG: ATP-binding cassette domain-containing protein [Chlorobium sp.]